MVAHRAVRQAGQRSSARGSRRCRSETLVDSGVLAIPSACHAADVGTVPTGIACSSCPRRRGGATRYHRRTARYLCRHGPPEVVGFGLDPRGSLEPAGRRRDHRADRPRRGSPCRPVERCRARTIRVLFREIRFRGMNPGAGTPPAHRGESVRL